MPPGVIVARARRAEWHWMFTATGFWVMWVAATRPLGTTCSDAEGAKIEAELSEAVNELGIGPQGLGGRSTSFRVHVEVAATHITMNPVAVNIQCH